MISVIVPVYNGEGVIASCLKSLLNQNYPKNKYEIIVVDDGSTDDTTEIVSRFKRVKLIKQKHKGPATARNLGVKKSRGQIVLFTDADCVPPKNWIKNMIEPFKDKKIVGVSGTYKTLNKKSLVARFVGYEIEERHDTLKKRGNIDFMGTFSAAYRKNIFSKFGGFDTSFPTASGEDPELSFRINKAGFKMVFQPKSFVYHRHPNSLWKLIKQKFWRGYWRVFLYNKHKDKMFRHSYTPKSAFIEEAFLGIAFLFVFLALINFLFSYYRDLSSYFVISFIFLILTFLFTLPLAKKMYKKDKEVGFWSTGIIILRELFTGFGIICGLLSLLYKKLK
ncbi:MAG: glycosyltransferase family 2 protein [Asgard group archaeon]